jgi:hypothetical protein
LSADAAYGSLISVATVIASLLASVTMAGWPERLLVIITIGKLTSGNG